MYVLTSLPVHIADDPDSSGRVQGPPYLQHGPFHDHSVDLLLQIVLTSIKALLVGLGKQETMLDVRMHRALLL